MRSLLGEETKMAAADDAHVEAGHILKQTGGSFETYAEVKDSYCLLCRRRTATGALLPCGHLCVCEPCQKERIATVKQCPICKQDVYGAVAILADG
jgi:hypothetical protein